MGNLLVLTHKTTKKYRIMKKSLFTIALLLICSIVFISCDKDDNLLIKNKYASELKQLFPSASHVEWSAVGAYGIAEFNNNGGEVQVWFTDNATSTWQMTETDMLYANLPQAIKSAFESSKYKNWAIDDVDQLDRFGVEVIYAIEVEYEELDMFLYYSAEGILVQTKKIDDDNFSLLPSITNQSTAIDQYIATHYSGAKIIHKDIDNGFTEIDIIHENKHKELTFNTKNEWISTVTDLNIDQTPQQILTAISSNPKYSAYQIDDVEFWQTPSGNYYEIELESAKTDIKVKVLEDGLIIN